MDNWDILLLIALGSVALSAFLTFYYFPKQEEEEQEEKQKNISNTR